MSVAVIGLIFAALAGLAVFRSQSATLFVFGLAALFQAASALAFGPANITPGHLVLGFFGLAVVVRQGGLAATAGAMIYPRAGFYLALATLWGVCTAILMPRLFANEVMVIPLATELLVYKLTPLVPSSTNINQAVYFIGNLAAFSLVVGMVRHPQAMVRAARALLLVCAANVVIALVDAATYAAGVGNLLDFMRNADYSQLVTAEVAGMKRMTGSFPEASAFAGWSVGLFAFALRLWRGGVFAPLSGYIAGGLLLVILLAFSSSGYAALAVYLVVVYSRNLLDASAGLGRVNRMQYRRYFIILLGPVSALLAAIAVAVRPDLLDPVTAIFDQSVTTKLASDSGVERMAWNMSGLRNIIETFGLGVGLGSVRVSSFLIALPANIGIIGSIFFGLFVWRVFTAGSMGLRQFGDAYLHIRAAARSGCFALLLAAAVSASSADIGLLFFLFAGLACADFRNVRILSRARVPEGDGPDGAA